MAVAQGLAFGAGLRVVPVTTLEALAFAAVRNGARQVLACLDARMGEVYWGCFAADAGRGVAAIGAAAGGAARQRGAARAEGRARRGIGRGFTAYPVLGALRGLELDPDGRAGVAGCARVRPRSGRCVCGWARLAMPRKSVLCIFATRWRLTEAERAPAGSPKGSVMELSQPMVVIVRSNESRD